MLFVEREFVSNFALEILKHPINHNILTDNILHMYRLYYRQEGKAPIISKTTHRRVRKAIAALPEGTEWELYRKGLFASQWRIIDYGVVRPLNFKS